MMILAMLAAAAQDEYGARIETVRVDRLEIGYEVRIGARTKGFPTGARLTFDVERIFPRFDWAADVLSDGAEAIRPGKTWADVDAGRAAHAATVPAMGYYRLEIRFEPTRQKDPAVERTMRRDFRSYAFEERFRAGDLRQWPAAVQRSWNGLEQEMARWDANFARLEEFGEDEQARAAFVQRRQGVYGRDNGRLIVERDESLLRCSTGLLSQLTDDFNTTLSVWINPPDRTGDGPYPMSWFGVAKAEITPASAREWIRRIPEAAVREHALLEVDVMAEMSERLTRLIDDASGRLSAELKRLDEDRTALLEIHAIVVDSERFDLYARTAACLDEKKKKIDLTLEDLIAGFAAIIESAPDALATDPEALRASLGKLDVDLGRMREALWAGDEKP